MVFYKEKERKALTRRYFRELSKVKSLPVEALKIQHPGARFPSSLVSPDNLALRAQKIIRGKKESVMHAARTGDLKRLAVTLAFLIGKSDSGKTDEGRKIEKYFDLEIAELPEELQEVLTLTKATWELSKARTAQEGKRSTPEGQPSKPEEQKATYDNFLEDVTDAARRSWFVLAEVPMATAVVIDKRPYGRDIGMRTFEDLTSPDSPLRKLSAPRIEIDDLAMNGSLVIDYGYKYFRAVYNRTKTLKEAQVLCRIFNQRVPETEADWFSRKGGATLFQDEILEMEMHVLAQMLMESGKIAAPEFVKKAVEAKVMGNSGYLDQEQKGFDPFYLEEVRTIAAYFNRPILEVKNRMSLILARAYVIDYFQRQRLPNLGRDIPRGIPLVENIDGIKIYHFNGINHPGSPEKLFPDRDEVLKVTEQGRRIYFEEAEKYFSFGNFLKTMEGRVKGESLK